MDLPRRSPRKKDKFASRADAGSQIGLAAMAGNIQLEEFLARIARLEAETQEANRRAEKERAEKEEANRRTEEANRRAEKERAEKEEANRRTEEANRRAEKERAEKEEANRRTEEANRRAEKERAEKEEANRRAERERAEKEEANRHAESVTAENEHLRAEITEMARKAEDWQKAFHEAHQKLEEANKLAEAGDSSKWKTLEVVLKKKPGLLAQPAPHTQQSYEEASSMKSSSSSKQHVSSGAGLTRVHPPQYATLLRWKSPQPENAAADKFVLKREVTVKSAPTPTFKLYQHQPTGLLLSAPAEQKIPEGVYESCLKRWETSAFKEHLMTAESTRLKVDSVVYEIFARVKAVRLNDMVDEFAHGNYRFEVIKSEKATELALTKSIFFLLEHVFNKAIGKDDIQFSIGSGESGPSPKLTSIRIVDRTYDIIYKKEKLFLRIVQEDKAAYKFPGLWKDFKGEADKDVIMSNLVDFYESKIGREMYADKNALMQLRLYLGIHQRCFGVVCSLNCWTFVKLEEDGTMHVSKRYMANENDPELGMGMLEVLIRFICAAIGDQGVMRDRPDFIKQWATSLFGDAKGENYTIIVKSEDFGDDDDDADDGKDADGEGEGGSKQDKSTNGGNRSSSKKRTASNARSGGDSSSSAAGGRRASSRLPGPRCWGDLEDPRRNAKDNNLTYEQHMSPLGTLEGDAVHIGTGRTGWVLRKEFDGIDMAIKLLCPSVDCDEGKAGFEMRSAELANEQRIYKKLEVLQGDVVPRCFGLRWFGALDIQAFVTEYVGPVVTCGDDHKVLAHQAESALSALEKIHEAGVLHGDVVNLRNVLWDESRQRVMFIDFAFGQSREEFKDEKSWIDAIQNEENDLRKALGLKEDKPLEPQSPVAAVVIERNETPASSSPGEFPENEQNQASAFSSSPAESPATKQSETPVSSSRVASVIRDGDETSPRRNRDETPVSSSPTTPASRSEQSKRKKKSPRKGKRKPSSHSSPSSSSTKQKSTASKKRKHLQTSLET